MNAFSKKWFVPTKFWKLKIKHYLRTHIHTNHEKTTQMIVDQDTQWKEIITDLWEDFVEFFLPQAYPFVDFSKKPVFLEQELHKLIRDKEKKGKRINDKLVKVFLKDGSNHQTPPTQKPFWCCSGRYQCSAR